ncbi:MAG: GGDEF domain-containing protein [Rubrivivax sp.]|nr:GGDEF domain-containing protein [Rubrivivax sp.]
MERLPLQPSLGPTPIGDCAAMLGAVQTRLREAADGDTRALGPRPTLREQVLECVDALDKLRRLLAAHAEQGAAHPAPGMACVPVGTQAMPAPDTQVRAVLCLDLDGLAAIKATHGPAAGDALLHIVGARLARSVRAADRVSCIEGDKFACLLGNRLSREQLSHLACKLFDAVSAPLKIGKLELTVRPSIGVATWPEDGASIPDLVRRADMAMQLARRRQMGYAFCDAGSVT